MRLLGAVLAGGASSRFGSDKAMALLGGKPLIEHVITALLPQVDALVIIGRDHPGHARIDDLPAPGLGPLGGLCGALDHGLRQGFDAVLCAPCDTIDLPADLARRLAQGLAAGPAVALGQRSIGMWPASLAADLLIHLAGPDRSIRSWIAATQAREIDCGAMRNVNRPGDLCK